jgi:hypothetical protein
MESVMVFVNRAPVIEIELLLLSFTLLSEVLRTHTYILVPLREDGIFQAKEPPEILIPILLDVLNVVPVVQYRSMFDVKFVLVHDIVMLTL